MLSHRFNNDITTRSVITKGAMENAVKVCQAISGSTNAVLHLAAIAHEAELDMNVLDAFDALGKTTPQVARVNPAAKWNMEDFWMAGGIPRVMERLSPLLDVEALTVSGKRVKENIFSHRYSFPANDEIIKTLEEPFEASGGIAVLRGNLAPNTAISKPGAINPKMRRFTGEARVFDSEEAALEAILDGKISDGHVVVIRYEGPKGGPGMREMYKAMKYLYGLGLAESTALVTDGRFSGTNNGCFVGHISPEASEGGPLAIVKDGDRITIDVTKGELTLQVPDGEITERLARWQPPEPRFTKGYLALYSRLASSAAEGAIIRMD